MASHEWLETDYPECLDPAKPWRWCVACELEQYDDGSIRPGWITKAPCYETQERKKAMKHNPCPVTVGDTVVFQKWDESVRRPATLTARVEKISQPVPAYAHGVSIYWLTVTVETSPTPDVRPGDSLTVASTGCVALVGSAPVENK